MPAPFQFRGNGPQNDRYDRYDRARGPRDQRRPPRRPEFTFRVPRPTAERPLLSTKRETTPEQLQGDEASDKPVLKFAALDTLSDSEEAEMDFSDDSDEEARPRKRRALGSDGQNDSSVLLLPPAPTSKWSNPDPYTALPPPDESQHKRVDVVKLIRKARLANAAPSKQNDAVVDNQDFISLGMIDGSTGAGSKESEDSENRAPENAPKGPRGMEIKGAATKRARDEDQPKGYSPKIGKPQRRYNSDASILSDWRPLPGQNPAPWMADVHPNLNPAARLHNEIVAFYSWVRPHMYEQYVREDLISRLETAFQNRYGNIQLRPFGSFASGLYLPVADIDLVLLSTQFLDRGNKFYGVRKGQIYAFSAFVRDLNIAVPGSIETIAHARVPILKFIDRLTGLRVDLSFDNDSGILANRTFQGWKEQFPAMPLIVSVIKQFLLLRGLNEVATGGLGGFSITCLVASLLQHMPKEDQQNVGHVLLEFFNFYGNRFKYRDVGIRMEPPEFTNKYFGSRDRLYIEDPNNSTNDISGGTREIGLIFRAFADAHRALKGRLDSFKDGSKPSMLDAIIAANFDEYAEQRRQLRYVFDTSKQFAKYRNVPPPPPVEEEAPAPPPPTSP
ncbi:hypothetical protein N7494_002548 [Penicillium frequentans]|uniref:polynucleotide adenylyltransferase n=1 Tax=Penicillium frequentans TaxID=3151616 RepID=A0AAD6D417_9EURO|nr:hypothetical protein N7494_002548 [Penicillium glabrum]